MERKHTEPQVLNPGEGLKQIITHNDRVISPQGMYFLDLVKVMATVGAEVLEGAGGKSIVAPPGILIARAADITTRAFEEMAERGWTVPTPPFESLKITQADFIRGNRS